MDFEERIPSNLEISEFQNFGILGSFGARYSEIFLKVDFRILILRTLGKFTLLYEDSRGSKKRDS